MATSEEETWINEPQPHRVLHPYWGYACFCKTCDKRFDSAVSMDNAEAKYSRHWQRVHNKPEPEKDGGERTTNE